MTKSHSDIKPGQGILGVLPEGLRSYALLARLDRPIGIWLLLLPGWWAIVLAGGGIAKMTGRDWWLFILFGIGAVVMRSAGCVINDLWDRDLDKQVGRTRLRPLASGAVSVKQAGGFLIVLLCVGLTILLQMNWMTVMLGFLSVPLIVAYPLMKRVTWWPQLFLGLTFNFGALMGWSAVRGAIEAPALLLYVGGIFWTLGYDTIYAHQDKEDDALAGIKSTARLFGKQSKNYVSFFYLMAGILVTEAFKAIESIWSYKLVPLTPYVVGAHFLATAVLVAALCFLFFSARRWKPEDQASSLATFKLSRIFGFLVLFAFAIIV